MLETLYINLPLGDKFITWRDAAVNIYLTYIMQAAHSAQELVDWIIQYTAPRNRLTTEYTGPMNRWTIRHTGSRIMQTILIVAVMFVY